MQYAFKQRCEAAQCIECQSGFLQTPNCLPAYFAYFRTYTLIPTFYRALLTSAVSGNGQRTHTTKESGLLNLHLWLS